MLGILQSRGREVLTQHAVRDVKGDHDVNSLALHFLRAGSDLRIRRSDYQQQPGCNPQSGLPFKSRPTQRVGDAIQQLRTHEHDSRPSPAIKCPDDNGDPDRDQQEQP